MSRSASNTPAWVVPLTPPYEGYSRDELVEVVDDEILVPAWDQTEAYRGEYSTNVLNGQLAHFRQLDERHALPPGTSRELLAAIAEARYPVTILQRSHNTVRIQRLWGEELIAWEDEHEG